MKKSISTDLNPDNIANVLAVLAESARRLEKLRESVPAVKWTVPLGKNERTPIEVLAHMLHGEARSAEMIYQALLVDEPFFADVHPERGLGKLLRFDQLAQIELIEYFKIRRKILLQVLTNIKEKDWTRGIEEEGKQRKESVYWRARTIAMHELDHFDELEKKMR